MKKKQLPRWAGLALWLGLSGLCMLVSLWVQRGALTGTLRTFLHEPVLVAFNFWPMLVMTGILFCLMGNWFYAAGFTELVWGVLSYINTLKVSARGDPFVPGDVLLLSEGLEAVGDYHLELHLGKLAVVLGVFAMLMLLGKWIAGIQGHWWRRLAAAASLAGLFVGSMALVYDNDPIYQGLKGPDRSNVPAVFENFGFPYCFLHNFNLYPVDCPPGYSRAEAASWEAQKTRTEEPEVRPHVVMVMCEAFSDLPNEPVFTGENPIAAFNALAEEAGTIAGQLVVSNFGAGTANTEFDVLTGMMTNRIGTGTTSAFRVVHRDLDSLPRMFQEAGYSTLFFHPGQRWFYNRESVYSYLGITDQIFADSMENPEQQGGWITDASFLQTLTQAIGQRQGNGPTFTYAVTIQNHQAYTYEKYDTLPPPVQSSAALSDAAQEYLSVYWKGLKDSAEMLQHLTEFLEQQQEPYLLVFFGDHRPNLGANYLAYEELGLGFGSASSTQERLEIYSVPFLIWGNDAYRQTHDLQKQAQAMQLTGDVQISSHYLGALTAQLAGLTGRDAYFDYLNELRTSLPVDSVYGYRLADGTWVSSLPDGLQAEVDKQWRWQYYRLKEQSPGANR